MLSVRTGGILLADKPSGPTSHDIVARARRALGTRRIGHTGTLDPFASGLLLLCVDSATRLAEYLTGLDKTYEAVMRLGERTDTLDPEGRVVERSDSWRSLRHDDVSAALEDLVGRSDQLPPQFSAKKVGGEAMYRRARRGERVELEPVEIQVHESTLVHFDPPDVRFRVRCSRGTYVRVLARDLAVELKTCGSLTELRRTRVGTFDVADALSLERLDALSGPPAPAEGDPPSRPELSWWREPLAAVGHMPRVEVTREEAIRLAHGQAVRTDVSRAADTSDGPDMADEDPIVIYCDGRLVALAKRRDGLIRPRKVFVDA